MAEQGLHYFEVQGIHWVDQPAGQMIDIEKQAPGDAA